MTRPTALALIRRLDIDRELAAAGLLLGERALIAGYGPPR